VSSSHVHVRYVWQLQVTSLAAAESESAIREVTPIPRVLQPPRLETS
jgi:hypothetical protein